MQIPKVNGRVDINKALETIETIPPWDMSNWGPKMWSLLEYMINFIPCGKCEHHGEEMISFEHDLVNIHKGKAIYNPELFKRYLTDILEAVKNYDLDTGQPLESCTDESCVHINKEVMEMR